MQGLLRYGRHALTLTVVGAMLLVVLSPASSVAMTAVDAAQQHGYPYPNAPDCNEQTGGNCLVDQWGFYQGQCHSWVAYRLNELNAAELNGATFNEVYRQPSGREWGSVWHWGIAAAAAGITVNDTPELGSLAWWASDGGHVGYVEGVNADGSVPMSEMNLDLHNSFEVATLQRGQRWPDGFIHIADRPASRPDPTTTVPTSVAPATIVPVAPTVVHGLVPRVPGAPTRVHAVVRERRTTVTWAAAPDHGSPVFRYIIREYRGSRLIKTVATGAVTHVTIGSRASKVGHAFKVLARSRIGTGPPSAPSKPAASEVVLAR